METGTLFRRSAGASLFVVYRDPTEPLRKIVVHDGIVVQSEVATTTTHKLQGFYKSSATPSAKLTYIGGATLNNPNQRLIFNGSVIPTNLFPGGQGASDRGWANPTFDVSSLMANLPNELDYGETATTIFDHSDSGPYECPTLAAIIFSTAVQDADGDGLPDGLEAQDAVLKDPDGVALPNLYAMGARTGQKDIIVELNAMKAPALTTYGSPAAPFDSTVDQVTDVRGHIHLPTPEVIRVLGDTLLANNIHAHVDVGPLSSYHALLLYAGFVGVSPYASTDAECVSGCRDRSPRRRDHNRNEVRSRPARR